VKRLGPNAYPFCLEVTPIAPPSVQLVPAKEYSGAPIGTSYDVRAFVGKLVRRSRFDMTPDRPQGDVLSPATEAHYLFRRVHIAKHADKAHAMSAARSFI
jgi:hypothetical protein